MADADTSIKYDFTHIRHGAGKIVILKLTIMLQ